MANPVAFIRHEIRKMRAIMGLSIISYASRYLLNIVPAYFSGEFACRGKRVSLEGWRGDKTTGARLLFFFILAGFDTTRRVGTHCSGWYRNRKSSKFRIAQIETADFRVLQIRHRIKRCLTRTYYTLIWHPLDDLFVLGVRMRSLLHIIICMYTPGPKFKNWHSLKIDIFGIIYSNIKCSIYIS